MDTSQNSGIAVANSLSGLGKDTLNELRLSIIEGIGELLHLVIGLVQSFSIGHQHGANKILLSIQSCGWKIGLGFTSKTQDRNRTIPRIDVKD